MAELPPLPPGFTLDAQPAADIPPLPPGFTLDAAPSAQPRGPQEGDVTPATGVPEGFYSVTGDDGRRTLRRNLGARDIAQSALDLPGVGTAANLATGAYNTGVKALSGLAGIFTGGNPEAVRGTQEALRIEPAQTRDPISQGFALAQRGAEKVTAPVERAVAGMSPGARTAIEATAEAIPDVAGVLGARVPLRSAAREVASSVRGLRPRLQTPEEIISRLDTGQSMGAAAAAPSLQNVSPRLREAISSQAQRAGGAVNPEVLARHIEADTLPVPMQLSVAEASQDAGRISKQWNDRGTSPEILTHMERNNRALGENLRAVREEAGPEVFSTNAVEHGESLIGAYRALNDAAETQINARYQSLRDAAGGELPVDAARFWNDASARLRRQLLFEHAPRSIMVQLRAMRDSGMNFEQFEAMRTNLAAVQRSHTSSGLERRAAGTIRQALEDLPLQERASGLKALADEARRTSRAQFEALEADPAYAAAVEGSVPPDSFARRFIVNAPRHQVERMRASLAENQNALQTMGVAAIEHLRDQARLLPAYEGNFASASFNKALRQLDPKLRSLVTPQIAETLEKLGNVARYTTHLPRGSFPNLSNTAVATAAREARKEFVRAIPGGEKLQRVLEARWRHREVRESLEPGAGLGLLAPATRTSSRNRLRQLEGGGEEESQQ